MGSLRGPLTLLAAACDTDAGLAKAQSVAAWACQAGTLGDFRHAASWVDVGYPNSLLGRRAAAYVACAAVREVALVKSLAAAWGH